MKEKNFENLITDIRSDLDDLDKWLDEQNIKKGENNVRQQFVDFINDLMLYIEMNEICSYDDGLYKIDTIDLKTMLNRKLKELNGNEKK